MLKNDLTPNKFFGTFFSPEALVKAHYREVYPQIEEDSSIFRNMDMVKEHFNLTSGDNAFYHRTPDCRYFVVI